MKTEIIEELSPEEDGLNYRIEIDGQARALFREYEDALFFIEAWNDEKISS